MRRILLLVGFISLASHLFGQVGFQSLGVGVDPEKKAIEILDQTCDIYDSYSTLQIEFRLSVTHPAFNSSETILGFAQGDKYRLSSKNQEIVCDGVQVWFQSKPDQQVEVSTPDPNEVNIIQPSKMLRLYQRNYDFNFGGTFSYENTKLYKLEFLPKTGLERFSKINVYIDQTSLQIIRISRFGKDNSLSILDLKSTLYNIRLDPSLFIPEMS